MDKDISFDGCTYSVSNIYSSIRYDVDRLDINVLGKGRPVFVRGLRIVDSASDVTAILDGAQADELVHSLALIRQESKGKFFQVHVDKYLMNAMLTEIFLVSDQKEGAARSSGPKEVSERLH